MKLIMIGPTNAGKGTQAAEIAARYDVPAISTGAMLRQAVDEGSELGQRVESILKSGRLVDDETMARLVAARLQRDDTADGFLLDGYPRTLGQAETLREILDERDEELDAVVLLNVPDGELIKRGLTRGREDDTEEVLQERLKSYREDTEPLVGYYRESGLLVEVDGNRPIGEVTSRIFERLDGVASGDGVGA